MLLGECLPNGMELISTQLFLIRDGPPSGSSVCGPWTGTEEELSAPADVLHLQSSRNNFVTVLLRSKLWG